MFNQIISKYKLAHPAPTISHRHIPYPRTCFANLLRYAKSRNINLYVFDSFIHLVLSRFEIEHECDVISFVFIICSTFGLILAPACSFFLSIVVPLLASPRFSITTLHRMKQKWFEGFCDRQVLQYALAFVPLFWLYESLAIVTNFYRFANV